MKNKKGLTWGYSGLLYHENKSGFAIDRPVDQECDHTYGFVIDQDRGKFVIVPDMTQLGDQHATVEIDLYDLEKILEKEVVWRHIGSLEFEKDSVKYRMSFSARGTQQSAHPGFRCTVVRLKDLEEVSSTHVVAKEEVHYVMAWQDTMRRKGVEEGKTIDWGDLT